MSHVAIYKVDLKNINKKIYAQQSFLTTLRKALEQIFKVELLDANKGILYYENIRIAFTITDDGELKVYVADFQERKFKEENVMAKLKQALILTSQIYKYKKHRIVYKNNRLMAEVLV